MSNGIVLKRTPKHLAAPGGRPLWLEDLTDLPAPILAAAPVFQIRVAPSPARPVAHGEPSWLARIIEDHGRAASFFGSHKPTVLDNAAGTWVLVPDTYAHLGDICGDPGASVSRALRGSGRSRSGSALAFEAMEHESEWVPQDHDWRRDGGLLAACARRLLSAVWLHPNEATGPIVLTARLTGIGARLVMEHSNYSCSRQVRLPSTAIARSGPVVLPDASALTLDADGISRRVLAALRGSGEIGLHRSQR